ncbi:MAG: DUF4395 domain-containing protein [Actinobacteria bacterium]|nr:DUF4395 domain-containing protein [Actinomycetota bacterium]MDA2985449.1 DUF4395 domain-containing protein [Actinomycetota bacterium]
MNFENPTHLISEDKNSLGRAETLIDARGPRFGAAITVLVLTLAIVLKEPLLLIWQAVAFGMGATFGPQRTPYAFIFKTLVKPRLTGPVPTEDVRPPQFAQAVGFLFALFALLGVAIGSDLTFFIATGFALAAAFLNSAFDFCLGCEMYLLLTRAFKR